MNWTHLPVAGGLYDQHPDLLDDFVVVMSIEAQVEESKREARERENRNKSKAGSASRGRRRR